MTIEKAASLKPSTRRVSGRPGMRSSLTAFAASPPVGVVDFAWGDEDPHGPAASSDEQCTSGSWLCKITSSDINRSGTFYRDDRDNALRFLLRNPTLTVRLEYRNESRQSA
jgi:hypothetical protein